MLNKYCPRKIPLAGPNAGNNDCFVVRIDNNGKPYLLLHKLISNSVDCLRWNENHYKDSVKFKISEIEIKNIEITHYYKNSIITFSSLNDFRLHYYTKIIYIKEYIKKFFFKSFQFLYNRKKLIVPTRINILKKIVNIYISEPSSKFDSITISSLFNLSKWISHPKSDEYIRGMQLNLDSLVESKDLERTGLKYNIRPQSILTLNIYEENEIKYRKQIRLKWLTLVAAFALVFFAFMQLLLKYLENKS